MTTERKPDSVEIVTAAGSYTFRGATFGEVNAYARGDRGSPIRLILLANGRAVMRLDDGPIAGEDEAAAIAGKALNPICDREARQ